MLNTTVTFCYCDRWHWFLWNMIKWWEKLEIPTIHIWIHWAKHYIVKNAAARTYTVSLTKNQSNELKLPMMSSHFMRAKWISWKSRWNIRFVSKWHFLYFLYYFLIEQEDRYYLPVQKNVSIDHNMSPESLLQDFKNNLYVFNNWKWSFTLAPLSEAWLHFFFFF